ncbi:hypothetical protein ACFQ1S_16930 [Kibdelosporangium lantanae]|uniref:Dihydrodipicolinate reductase N-terminal domain-containing protein n=1 Tax=Kibdelosporangium lantanae TaxID=1497396 RepID=A0ABW3MBX4_9PSEU
MRVVLWSTGNVGRHALAGIVANPLLELVGVWTSTPAKVGVDAGDPTGDQAGGQLGGEVVVPAEGVQVKRGQRR